MLVFILICIHYKDHYAIPLQLWDAAVIGVDQCFLLHARLDLIVDVTSLLGS